MISVIQNGAKYEIRFPYDPNVIPLIKQVPGWWWNNEDKIWTIPKDRLGFLLAQFKGTQYESSVYVQSDEQLNMNQTLDATQVIPDIDISDVNFRVEEGSAPFEHQLDFMKFAKWRQAHGYRSGFILGDQPGAGKTLEVMNLALYNRDRGRSKHCLIICCVNGAKYNWREDIIKHTRGQEDPYILGSRFRRDKVTIRCNTGSKEKIDDLRTGYKFGKEQYGPLPYFLIVNIEAFRAKEGKKYAFTEEIIRLVNEGEIDLIAIDEVHKNASPSSKQGQQLLKIKKTIKRKIEWIPMTGTPITKKPTDVFLPLRLVDGHDTGSYYLWCQDFCVFGGFAGNDIIGYKNMDVLKNMLQPNMLRRLKKDILKNLPPKIRYTEYIENSAYQSKLYAQLEEELIAARKKVATMIDPRSAFLRLRQVNGSPELVDPQLAIDDKYLSKNAKLSRCLELIDEIVENGEKVIIFSNWVEPLRTLYKFVSKRHKTCCYTGTMAPDVREHHKEVFMQNPNYPVMIGTVGAMGTSHTLTVARNIIFYDEPWNPSDREQCEDRCHRPGAEHESINIYTLISNDTVDERVHKVLHTKEGIANYIVDNELDIRNHPELLDMMLGCSPY